MAYALAEELKRAMRTRHGQMTQKQAAVWFDVDQSTISRWLRGASSVHPSMFDQVAEFTGLSYEQVAALAFEDQRQPSQIFTGDDAPTSTQETQRSASGDELVLARLDRVEALLEELLRRSPPAE